MDDDDVERRGKLSGSLWAGEAIDYGDHGLIRKILSGSGPKRVLTAIWRKAGDLAFMRNTDPEQWDTFARAWRHGVWTASMIYMYRVGRNDGRRWPILTDLGSLDDRSGPPDLPADVRSVLRRLTQAGVLFAGEDMNGAYERGWRAGVQDVYNGKHQMRRRRRRAGATEAASRILVQ